MANGKHIRAYFITNLAITLVRQTIATALGCVLRPVFGLDTSFVDPVTSRDFPILWETRINISYSNRSETVVAYVVKDEEIGFPLLAGMDTILSLQGCNAPAAPPPSSRWPPPLTSRPDVTTRRHDQHHWRHPHSVTPTSRGNCKAAHLPESFQVGAESRSRLAWQVVSSLQVLTGHFSPI